MVVVIGVIIAIFITVVCIALFHWWGLLVGIVLFPTVIYFALVLGEKAEKRKREEDIEKLKQSNLSNYNPSYSEEVRVFIAHPEVNRILTDCKEQYFKSFSLPSGFFTPNTVHTKRIRFYMSQDCVCGTESDIPFSQLTENNCHPLYFKIPPQPDARKCKLFLSALCENIAFRYTKTYSWQGLKTSYDVCQAANNGALAKEGVLAYAIFDYSYYHKESRQEKQKRKQEEQKRERYAKSGW